MGQKAKNAGKKKSKICTKIADAKSLKHNVPRHARKKMIDISGEQHLLDVALKLPECLCDDYEEIAFNMWQKKQFSLIDTKNFLEMSYS